MAILDIFRKKKLKYEDVRLECAKMEQKEKKLASEIQSLAREKEELFRKGSQTQSRSLRMVYARKFEETTKRLMLAERESLLVWKQVRLLHVLRDAMERSRKHGGSNILFNLTDKQIGDLMGLIENDNIKGEVFMERMNTMLGLIEAADKAPESIGEEGQEVLRVWEKMDEGRLEFDEGLKKASEDLEKKGREPA